MDEKPTLLIVENDQTLLQLLARNFTKQGYEVTMAECPRTAIAAATSQAFDAAILDGRLPQCDGVHLMGELQGIQPKLPTIILSAHAEPEFQKRCLDNGAFAYLRKPSSLEALESTVTAATQQSRSEPGKQAAQASFSTKN